MLTRFVVVLFLILVDGSWCQTATSLAAPKSTSCVSTLNKKQCLLSYRKTVLDTLIDRFVATDLDDIKWTKSARYSITIERSGKPSAVKILEGTGNPVCDQKLRRMLLTTNFKSIPTDCKEPRITFKFTYRCNHEMF